MKRSSREHQRPLVEVLYFEGCPNYRDAVALARRVSDELRLDARVVRLEVADTEAAERCRFVGSPTVRVGGRDVEPGADSRSDYALVCRVYHTGRGVSGLPDASWIRAALSRETGHGSSS